MRSIGTLPTESEAVVVASSLYVRGIESQLEREPDGSVTIWVLDDDQLKAATEILNKFRQTPDAPEFQKVMNEAQRRRALEVAKDKKRKSTVADQARLGYEKNFVALAWVPVLLAVLCIATGIWAGTLKSLFSADGNTEVISKFTITNILPYLTDQHPSGLPEVSNGEAWRLVSPIFLHFGILHLVFNLFWLKDLGSFIQNRYGAGYLILMVVVTAVLSNYAQFIFTNWPVFGGMSGVNYGLFGFLWFRGKFDRRAGWQLNPSIVQTMMVWFFLCLFQVIPHVANAAHAFGLLVGLAWGYGSAKLASLRGR